MASYNQVTIAGNVTRDIELRYSKSGTAVGNFSVAINSKYGDNEKVTFVECTVFDKQAENAAKYLGKGSPVLVGGRLDQQSWKDKEGNKRSKLVVIASIVQFLSTKSEDAGGRSRRDDDDEQPRRRREDANEEERPRKRSRDDDEERPKKKARRDDDDPDWGA